MTRASSLSFGRLGGFASLATLASLVALWLAGCTTRTLRVEPVKIEPIHLTIDVNLREAPGPSAPKQ